MTALEKKVLGKILKETAAPSAPGSAYEVTDAGMKPVKVEELVPGIPNHKLLDSDEYKAGYKRAVEEIALRVRDLFLRDKPDPKALKRYAGK